MGLVGTDAVGTSQGSKRPVIDSGARSRFEIGMVACFSVAYPIGELVGDRASGATPPLLTTHPYSPLR